MKKFVYINVSITYYNSPFMKPRCTFYHTVDSEQLDYKEISLEEAHRLMWELVKAGGEREYNSNQFDATISYASVRYGAIY